MDTSETFAHIYSQNSGVYSALIRLFIVDGQNLLVYDAFCLFVFGSLQALIMRGSREETWAK